MNLLEQDFQELRSIVPLPYELRTLLRFNLFLCFSKIEYSSISEIATLGFNPRTTKAFLTQFQKAGLVERIVSLYKLTDDGRKLLSTITTYPIAQEIIKPFGIAKPVFSRPVVKVVNS